MQANKFISPEENTTVLGLSAVLSEILRWHLESLGLRLQPLISDTVGRIFDEQRLLANSQKPQKPHVESGHLSSRMLSREEKWQQTAPDTCALHIRAMRGQGLSEIQSSSFFSLLPQEVVFVRLVRKFGLTRATDLATISHLLRPQPSPESRADLNGRGRSYNGRSAKRKRPSSSPASSRKRSSR
jgi:hypothetical protein